MLDSPPTCHKHDCLMGYQHAGNTGDPGYSEVLFSYL